MKGATLRISYPDGYTRSWRSLWRKRPRDRVLFIGKITGGQFTTGLNQPARVVDITAEDASAEMLRKWL